MGAEWERKRAEGFRKGRDQRLIQLGTPDLFTQKPERAPRVAVADIAEGMFVEVGDGLIIQKLGNRIALMAGLREVGYLTQPPSEIIAAMENSFGYAKGIVRVFHREASIAEISVC